MNEEEFSEEPLEENENERKEPKNKTKVKVKKIKKTNTRVKKEKPKTKIEKQIVYRNEKSGHPIIIFLMFLIIVCLSGYIVYDKVYKKDKPDKDTPVTLENTKEARTLSNEKALKLGNTLYKIAYENGLVFNGYSLDSGLIKYEKVEINDSKFIEDNQNADILNGGDENDSTYVYHVTNFDKAITDIYTENYIDTVIKSLSAFREYKGEYYLVNAGKDVPYVYKDTTLTIASNLENEITFNALSTFEDGTEVFKTFKIVKENEEWKVDLFVMPY